MTWGVDAASHPLFIPLFYLMPLQGCRSSCCSHVILLGSLGEWVGKDRLYQYFLKGKQYREGHLQPDLEIVLESATQCPILSFLGHQNKEGGFHRRSWVIQAAILYVGTKTQESEQHGKVLAFQGSKEGARSFLSGYSNTPIVVCHHHAVTKVTRQERGGVEGSLASIQNLQDF